TPGGTSVLDLGKLTTGNLSVAGVVSQVPNKGPGGAHSASFSYQNPEKEHFNGDTLSVSESVTYNDFAGLGGAKTSESGSGKPGESFSYSVSWVLTYGLWQEAPSMTPPTPITINPDGSTSGGGPVTIPSLFGQLLFRYDLSRDRTETIRFVMNSDIQPIVLLPPDEAINQINISMSGSD